MATATHPRGKAVAIDSYEVSCRVCGCSQNDPCIDTNGESCAWVGKQDLCTTCEMAVAALYEWSQSARRANMAALMREYRRREL
jgi:hypothetical protein